MTMRDALKAAGATNMIRRKATGNIVIFKSGEPADYASQNFDPFYCPTLEDVLATDWFPVQQESRRERTE